MAKYIEVQFYCLNCGKAGIPLRRKVGFQHSALHRKKLYCPNCKLTLNHVEIKNDEQKEDFLMHFSKGEFIDEAKSSIHDCGSSWMW